VAPNLIVPPFAAPSPIWPQSQSSRPQCIVAQAGTQTLTTSTPTAVAWTSPGTYDPSGMLSSIAPSEIFIPVAGVYLVVATVEFAANATGDRDLGIFVNGAGTGWATQMQADPASTTYMQVVGIMYLQALSYVQIMAFQSSGGNLNITGANGRLRASVMQLL
jgi:hypothetical protein